MTLTLLIWLLFHTTRTKCNRNTPNRNNSSQGKGKYQGYEDQQQDKQPNYKYQRNIKDTNGGLGSDVKAMIGKVISACRCANDFC